MIGFEEANPETEQGRALFQELLWVHGMIRRDLTTLSELSRDVAAGMPAAEVAARIDELKVNGPLWQLKVNCLRYCRFVHSHHHHEDALFFPRLRSANPELDPVVDRLESEHLRVSDLLDEVESAAANLDAPEVPESRSQLQNALGDLGETLLQHLDYEEERAGPTIRRLSVW